MKKITYIDCLMSCLSNLEFVNNFNRLKDVNLGTSVHRSAIEALLNQSPGFEDVLDARENVVFRQFALYVKYMVWERLPAKHRSAKCWVL